MKKLLILFSTILFVGCSSAPDQIVLNVQTTDWDMRGNSSETSSLIVVHNGDQFEPWTFAVSESLDYPVFEVKKIIDEKHVKIKYDREMIAQCSEDIWDPDGNNVAIISSDESTCFTTTTLDEGSTIYISVMLEGRTNSKASLE